MESIATVGRGCQTWSINAIYNFDVSQINKIEVVRQEVTVLKLYRAVVKGVRTTAEFVLRAYVWNATGVK